MNTKIRIGSRGSKLALWQANHVASQLAAEDIESEIIIIKTQGDKIQHLGFDKMEGKGFFTKEIEESLLREEIDIAVHSMKDLQTTMPKGLVIGAVSQREDPADWLIIKKSSFDKSKSLRVRKNAKIGTSSARRKALVREFRSDIQLEDIRGNVPTRISKIATQNLDGVILAAAGLKRLQIDLSAYEVIKLNPIEFIPAPAQGVLALQSRESDLELRKKLLRIHDAKTVRCTNIERGILKGMGGGCQMPIGVYCHLDKQNNYHLQAAYSHTADDPLHIFRTSSATSEGLIDACLDFFKKI